MSDFSVFLDDIRSWTMRPDVDDAVATSWVRFAETTLNPQIRVREALDIATTSSDEDGRVTLPADFNSMDYIRPDSSKPLMFVVKGDFFQLNETYGKYTIVGDQLLIGGPIREFPFSEIEMAYYRKVPKFVDESTWLHTYYYNIYLQSCVAAGALYSEEYDKASSMTSMISGMIESANLQSVSSQISGSVLKKRVGGRRLG